MSCLRPRRRAPAQRRVVPSRSDVPLPDAAPGCEDPPPPAPRFLSGEDPAGAGWAGRRARRGLRSAARPVWVPRASRARKGPGTRRAWWPFADERRADEPAGRAGAAPGRADSAPLACVSPAPGPPRSLLVIGAPDGRREVGGARTPRLSPAPWRSRSGSPRVDVPNTTWGCRRSAFRESRRDTFRSIVSLAPTVAIRQLILHFPQFLKSMCGRGWGLGLGGVGESSHRKRVPFLAYAKMWKDQSV